MKRKNVFPLGMLAMVLVFGFTGMGCAQLAGAAITGASVSLNMLRLCTITIDSLLILMITYPCLKYFY